jgi:hypothetical protein
MVTEGNNKRLTFLQYLNTTLLTLVGIFAFMIYTTVRNVRESQIELKLEMSELKTEDLRLKTIQDINVVNVENLNNRVNVLEVNYLDRLKEWIDANYTRKPQK